MKEEQTLHALEQEGNLRTLPEARHDGIWIWQDGQRMLNLSSNDYLGSWRLCLPDGSGAKVP